MPKTTRISKWGSSLAVRIPKAIAEEWGVKEGTSIELTRDAKGLVLKKRRKSLEEMVESLKNADLHPEVDWGPPRGKEVW